MLPGGQFRHPSTPLVETFVNVPSGHGVNSVLFWLNPEAKRADTYASLTKDGRSSFTLIASASELTGLLEK